jgi:hypothetical protein
MPNNRPQVMDRRDRPVMDNNPPQVMLNNHPQVMDNRIQVVMDSNRRPVMPNNCPQVMDNRVQVVMDNRGMGNHIIRQDIHRHPTGTGSRPPMDRRQQRAHMDSHRMMLHTDSPSRRSKPKGQWH